VTLTIRSFAFSLFSPVEILTLNVSSLVVFRKCRFWNFLHFVALLFFSWKLIWYVYRIVRSWSFKLSALLRIGKSRLGKFQFMFSLSMRERIITLFWLPCDFNVLNNGRSWYFVSLSFWLESEFDHRLKTFVFWVNLEVLDLVLVESQIRTTNLKFLNKSSLSWNVSGNFTAGNWKGRMLVLLDLYCLILCIWRRLRSWVFFSIQNCGRLQDFITAIREIH